VIKALQSGDYERVRGLFTKDGVLTTAGDAHSMIYRNKSPNRASALTAPCSGIASACTSGSG
jgi:hypothetical protein